MAHEKVYGICENKCRVEVLPKANFATLASEWIALNIQSVSLASGSIKIGSAVWEVALPEGFTPDNCFAVMYAKTSTDTRWVAFPNVPMYKTNESSGYLITSKCVFANGENKLRCEYTEQETSINAKNIMFKVMLIRL